MAGLDLLGDGERLVDGDGEPFGSRGLEGEACEAAVSIPITWPAVSTKAPPESPGWTSALTWIRPDSCSLGPSRLSLAVIDWLRAVMEPPALLGVPPVPPALPIATTDSPTAALEESPRVAVFRPEAPCSWRTAMSWVES